MFRSSLFISIMTAMNLIVSLFNQILLAKFVGASVELDAYITATCIPTIIGGAAVTFFSSSLVPVLITFKNDRVKMARAITTTMLITLLLSALILIIGYFLQSNYLSSIISDSIKLKQAMHISSLVWIITIIVIINGYLSSVYNVYNVFVWPALFQIFPPLGMCLGLAVKGNIEGMILGWLLMTALAFTFMFPVLILKGTLKINFIDVLSSYNKKFFYSFLPIAASILSFSILPVIDAYRTYQLGEGNLSYIGYCTRIVVALGTLIINGIVIVIMPHLSETVQNDDYVRFTQILNKSIRYSLFVAIPMCCFVGVNSKEIITLLLQRGEFTKDVTSNVASLLIYYLVGLVLMLPGIIVMKGYAARQKYQAMLYISFLSILFYYVVSGIMVSKFLVTGIGITYVIYWFCFTAGTGLALDNKIYNAELLVTVVKTAIATLVSIACILLIDISGSIFTTLAISASVYFTIFVVASLSLRITEMNYLAWKFRNYTVTLFNR